MFKLVMKLPIKEISISSK